MHADLFADEGEFTPRPAWQVIEAARRQMLTGELSLATSPTTLVYLRDGQVYFAERTTDGGIGVRLLVEGVITRQQMGKGAILVGGVEHLGRMFQRDPSIDRAPVELCVELLTDEVLTTVANELIGHYTMTMYQRHPSGIDRWLPNRVEVIAHIVQGRQLVEPDTPITPGAGPRHLTVVAPAPVPDAAATSADDVTAYTSEVPVRPLAAWATVTTELPLVSAFDPSPSTDRGANEAVEPLLPTDSGIRLAPSALDAMMSTGIADEVADAVRRALAAIDAATVPAPDLSPRDFVLQAEPPAISHV